MFRHDSLGKEIVCQGRNEQKLNPFQIFTEEGEHAESDTSVEMQLQRYTATLPLVTLQKELFYPLVYQKDTCGNREKYGE
jgi:hypothetical protein